VADAYPSEDWSRSIILCERSGPKSSENTA
jgi:hypothetical protein